MTVARQSWQYSCGSRRTRRLLVSIGVMAALIFGSAAGVLGHGTSGKKVEKSTVCLAFAYDEDEAMSHVKVTVTAPGSDTPFQTLATDRNGIACFAPDAPGEWRAVAGDGMGHQQMMVVPFAGEERPMAVSSPPRQPEVPRSGKLSGVLAGIAIIAAVTGIFAWYRARRRS